MAEWCRATCRGVLPLINNNPACIIFIKRVIMQYTLKMARCGRLLNKHNIVVRRARIVSRSSSSYRHNLEGLLPQKDEFQVRHIGPREHEQTQMLKTIGFKVSTYSKVGS